MTWWGIGIAAVSAATQIYGQQKAKKASEADAAFEASQRIAAAQRSRGIGQRQASEERRQARLVSSALQARAGGGGLDPSIVKLEQDIAAEGEYRALAALYEGEEGALGLEDQANAGLRSARAKSSAYDWQSASTAIGAAGSIYGQYQKGK